MAAIVDRDLALETAESRRFERELAMLIGIVEPDRAVTSTAPRGWIRRFLRSRSGSVGLGVAMVAAIGGTVAVTLRSPPAPITRSSTSSVYLPVPTIDKPISPVVQSVPVAPPTPIVASQASEERALVPVQAPTPRSDRSRPAIRVATVRTAPAAPVDDGMPVAIRPTMIAATNRAREDRAKADGPAISRPDDDGGGAEDMAGTLVATVPSAPPTPAPRRERRDTVDALRQLRHQW